MNTYTRKTKGRIRLTSNYSIVGLLEKDMIAIPKILAEVWTNHQKNVSESQKLINYYFNDTDIQNKTKVQRPDINNMISIPKAFEIQRKINSYANGTPREYTALSTEKQELLQMFNKYQLSESKHSKTQTANFYSSITGVGYYCVLPDYNENENVASYEIFAENFSPLNTFIVYENTMKGKEMLAVNYHSIEVDGVDYTELNVFTKGHQFVYRTTDTLDSNLYIIKTQSLRFNNELKQVQAIIQPFHQLPIIEVCYHPFRIGLFEIVIDLLDCQNLLISGDLDAVQQAIDYVLVLTDCELGGTGEVDDNGKEISQTQADLAQSRMIQISSNGGTNQAKVDILSNNFNHMTALDWLGYVKGLIEQICGVPTRKDQDVGGNSSTGTGAKNENGMRDLDDNADIIQAQALLSEQKFIKLVLAIDKYSPKKKLSGLEAIDVNVSFPRNEMENILTSAQAYATWRGAGLNDVDSLAKSKTTTDVIETAKRNAEEQEELRKQLSETATEEILVDENDYQSI